MWSDRTLRMDMRMAARQEKLDLLKYFVDAHSREILCVSQGPQGLLGVWILIVLAYSLADPYR